MLYVAGGAGVTRASADQRLIELLRIAGSQGVAISALDNGHALLTAAGLSDNNWASIERDILMHNYTDRRLSERSDALVYSLALVKRDLGYEIASSVAERLAFGNDQHISIILSTLGTPTLAEKAQESARWLERNCGNPVSVVDAARTAAMSERNFLRLFKRELGLTPSQYLLRARLKLTCELLANSDLSIDKIARRTGLSNGERLSNLFRKQLSMSPTEYRASKRCGSIS
jgi:transcriptional regulator GlxA family with amidase domain